MENSSARQANGAANIRLDQPGVAPRSRLDHASPERPRLCLMADLLDDLREDAAVAHAAKLDGVTRGPVTGFKKLDADLGGCLPVGLNIVHGQPGAGKSAFALQVAAMCEFPAIYVTCEMAPLELLRRQTARVTGTYLNRFKTGEMSPDECVALARRGAAASPYLGLIDATRAGADLSYLRECVDVIRARAAHDGHHARQVLLVIDSLHSWAEGVALSVPGGESSEYEVLNAALAGLRTLSHGANCPVLAIAERNRDSMKSGGLSAGAGTRKLEYSAETVFDLTRSEDVKDRSSVEVVVKLVKNRNGAAGKATPLLFQGAKQLFEER